MLKKKKTPKSATPNAPAVNKPNIPEKYKRQFSFNSSSMQACSSLLTPPEAPTLIYTDYVWLQIQYIVQKCTAEVGWLGLVEDTGNNTHTVTEIFVPEQEVTGAETLITSATMEKLTNTLLDQDKDIGALRYWGHSHVGMAVSPSGQDEEQIDKYLQHCNYFYRGIYNKKGNSKVDYYNTDNNIVHQCIVHGTTSTILTKSSKAKLDAMLQANVKKRTYTAPTNFDQWGKTYPNAGKFPVHPITQMKNAAFYADLEDEWDDDPAFDDLGRNLADPFYFKE